MSITGTWKKTSAGAAGDQYPETISFKEGNLYEAQAAAGAVRHPIWDAGTYHVAENRLDISTSTDAVVAYGFEQHGDSLSIHDEAAGCTVQYERV